MKKKILVSLSCVVLLLAVLCLPSNQSCATGRRFSSAAEEVEMVSHKAKTERTPKPVLTASSFQAPQPSAMEAVVTTAEAILFFGFAISSVALLVVCGERQDW